MTAAPALACDLCGRTIGKGRLHAMLTDQRVACSRCMLDRRNHAAAFPDCSTGWHDLADHLRATGTRAGIAATLGVWP